MGMGVSMKRIATLILCVGMFAGCQTNTPEPAKPTTKAPPPPAGACFCKPSTCLCAHCPEGKGSCFCKK